MTNNCTSQITTDITLLDYITLLHCVVCALTNTTHRPQHWQRLRHLVLQVSVELTAESTNIQMSTAHHLTTLSHTEPQFCRHVECCMLTVLWLGKICTGLMQHSLVLTNFTF